MGEALADLGAFQPPCTDASRGSRFALIGTLAAYSAIQTTLPIFHFASA